MENRLQMLKEMIEFVVEDSCCSVDFLHLNLDEQKPSMDCISKSGETIKLSL